MSYIKTIDYKKSKGYFKIKFLDNGDIYEGTINIDEDSLKTELANKILDNEEGSIFSYSTKIGNQENIENIEILEKNIKQEYIELDENAYYGNCNFIYDDFRNIKFEKQLDEKYIYFQFFYKPSEWKEPGTISNKIIFGLKNKNNPNYNDFIFFMKVFIKNFLKRYNLLNNYNYLCCVPPHEASLFNNGSIANMIKQICNYSAFIDGSQTLIRHKTIEEQKKQGKRYIETHLNSVRVNKNVVGKKIILIDDITTSGSSLKACKKLLLDAGASSVICFSFSKDS